MQNILRLIAHGRIGSSELARRHEPKELSMQTAPQNRRPFRAVWCVVLGGPGGLMGGALQVGARLGTHEQ
jgi:hypothetical protein